MAKSLCINQLIIESALSAESALKVTQLENVQLANDGHKLETYIYKTISGLDIGETFDFVDLWTVKYHAML